MRSGGKEPKYYVLLLLHKQNLFMKEIQRAVVKFCCLVILLMNYLVVAAWFGAWMNCLVHVVMYSYYGLSALPALKGKLWWKRYITRFQLVRIKSCCMLATPCWFGLLLCLCCFLSFFLSFIVIM